MLLESAQELGLVLRKEITYKSNIQYPYNYPHSLTTEDVLICAERRDGTLWAFYGLEKNEDTPEVYIYNSFGEVEEDIFRLELEKILLSHSVKSCGEISTIAISEEYV